MAALIAISIRKVRSMESQLCDRDADYPIRDSFKIYLELRYIGDYIRGMKKTELGEPDRQNNHPEGRFGRKPHHRTEAHQSDHRPSEGRHDEYDRGQHSHHGHHHDEHRGRGRHRGRFFDYGELRLLLLALIAERPRHGYELIKDIAERFGGAYSPSPGVIYPTLSWLDDMGYAAIELEAAGRKLYRITAEGEAFLVANRRTADALLARMFEQGEGEGEGAAEQVVMAMRRLKGALRHRLRTGGLATEDSQRIVGILSELAQSLETGE